VAGYRVYRAATVDGTFAIVSGASLIAATTWTDTSALVGETWYYKVSAVDTSGNESAQSGSASATRVVASQQSIRINLGGVAFTDGGGTLWQADQYFTGGTAAVGNFDVAGTTDDALYLARRYGAFTYAIPAVNGTYTLNLHLMDPLYTVSGKRLFSVKAEGLTILSNFDIAANGGGKAKLVKSFTVNITDGALNLQTIKNLDNPIISAIELIPQTVNPVAPTAPTAASTLTGVKVSWTAPATNGGAAPTGYSVYRASQVDGTYTKITTGLVTATTYVDTTAPGGATAYYKVTAVYGATESEQTAAASAMAPFAGAGTGLLGQYYSGTNFNTLKLTRTDPTVNFNWGTGAPNPALPVDNFSIRWTGNVFAPVTADYTFTISAGEGVRLWVNGQLIIDQFTPLGTKDYTSTPITLTAGEQYSIRLDYSERSGAALAKLFWQIPGVSKVIIPRQNLYTP
jgi:hypothetical protein